MAKRACLSCDLQCLSVNVCCVQETHLIANNYEGVQLRRVHLLSAYFDKCSRGFTQVVNCSLNTTCSLVFADLAGRLCLLDVTINGKAF